MLSPCDPKLQQSFKAAGLAGCWKLAPGRVLGVRPRTEGVLLITQGAAWATLNERPRGHGNESGDHFLQAGQQLPVCAGRHLVIESMDRAPVQFEWTPAARWSPRSRWDEAVRQPLRDLHRAGWLAGSALLRLLLGLAGYSEYLVAGRGRALSPHEVNPP